METKNLMLMAVMLSAIISRADSFYTNKSADWSYLVSNEEVTVTYIWPKSTELVIPTEINGVAVTHVAPLAFRGCNQIESVSIPPYILDLGEKKSLLFYGCAALETIIVDERNAVYSSMDGVLYDKSYRRLLKCPRKKCVVNVTSTTSEIELWAFRDSEDLVSVSLPLTLKTIGQEAFSGCKRLTGVDIPDGVTNIENLAFHNCDSLSTVKIPSAMHTIGFGAFQGCSGITSISIPSTVEEIGSWAFNLCTNLANVVLSEGVRRIELGAFSNCKALKFVRIPSTVDEITGGAFAGCSQLTEIQVDEHNQSYQSVDGLLLDWSGAELVTYPAGLESFHLPSGVSYIHQRAVAGCVHLTHVTIPDDVEVLGYRTFEGCTSLVDIQILASVRYIDEPFAECSSLIAISVDPANNAFQSVDGLLLDKTGMVIIRCPEGLSSVSIPSSVKRIGSFSFDSCSLLPSIDVSTNVCRVDRWAIHDCDNLTVTDSSGRVTYRDAQGRLQGTATTDSSGRTTYRDAQGRLQGTKK